jgi:3-hydroxyacyl-[acyl-carrier-protein] dehydratase
VVASYRWRADSDFYRGHFPGNPVTPGALLVESMAQAAVVGLGIYLLEQESPEASGKLVTLFTDVNVEFSGMVRPGQRVLIRGRKLFFRRRKLRSESEMRLEDGTLVCSGTLSGMGVAR